MNLLAGTFVCLFLNQSKRQIILIILLLFFLHVVLAFFNSGRVRLIVPNECIDLIQALLGLVRSDFDELRLNHNLPLNMIIVIFHDWHFDLEVILHYFVRNFALTHEKVLFHIL